MPDFKQLFSDEVRRLARKEVKAAVVSLTENVAALRKTVMEQRKQIAALEKLTASCRAASDKLSSAGSDAAAAVSADEPKVRINASGIVKLRDGLKITQWQLAALVGVAPHTVSLWETGKVVPRPAAKRKLAALRGIGKLELKKRLSADGTAAVDVESGETENK